MEHDGLSSDRVICSGFSISNKKMYILYYGVHYKVITNLKAAMAKKYICNVCDTLYGFTNKCDRVYCLCTAKSLRTKDCVTSNRWFLSGKCFQKHLALKTKGKLVRQLRHVCRNYSNYRNE